MSSSNNVRGPASALTEFLREAGITPTTIARRTATRNNPNGLAAAGPSSSAAQDQEGEGNDDEGEERRPKKRVCATHRSISRKLISLIGLGLRVRRARRT